MDKLKAMQYFCAIRTAGSFSAAARKEKVPVSTLSRAIQALEAELGAELVKRSTRHVALTEIGKIYVEQCQSILKAVERAEGQVGSYQSSPSGILRISALPFYAELRIQPLLEQFHSLYPDIILDLDLSNQVSDLSRDGIDIAFRGGSAPDERVIAQWIENNTPRLCASTRYLQQYGEPTTIVELAKHKAILYRATSSILKWHVSFNGEWHPIDIQPSLISSSGSAMLQALLTGQGMAMMPHWSVAKEVAKGKVEFLNFPETLSITASHPKTGIYMLYQKPQYEIPKIKVAVDYFKEKLKEKN